MGISSTRQHKLHKKLKHKGKAKGGILQSRGKAKQYFFGKASLKNKFMRMGLFTVFKCFILSASFIEIKIVYA